MQDTDAVGVVPEQQQVVLQYQGPDTGGVATADTPPVVLGRWVAGHHAGGPGGCWVIASRHTCDAIVVS